MYVTRNKGRQVRVGKKRGGGGNKQRDRHTEKAKEMCRERERERERKREREREREREKVVPVITILNGMNKGERAYRHKQSIRVQHKSDIIINVR